jgi:hypothetical protein
VKTLFKYAGLSLLGLAASAIADPVTRFDRQWPGPVQIEAAFAKVNAQLPKSVSWHWVIVSLPNELPVLTVISPASVPQKNTFCLVQFNRGAFEPSWRETLKSTLPEHRQAVLELIIAHEAAHCLERDQYPYLSPPQAWRPTSLSFESGWDIPPSPEEVLSRQQQWAETYADAFSFLHVSREYPSIAGPLIQKVLDARKQWAERDPGYQTHKYLEGLSFQPHPKESLMQQAFRLRYEGFLAAPF